MTRTLLPPEIEREFSTLKRRVSDLEKRLAKRLIETDTQEVIFEFDGPISVLTTSRFYSRRWPFVGAWIMSLKTAGSTATTVELLKNGSVALELVLAAGANRLDLGTAIALRPERDYLQARVATAGAGAAGLTVQGEAGQQ